MGTPDFAAQILKGLIDDPDIEVRCVYTQPDRPAGRGKKLLPPPVKVLAEGAGLPVRQPLTLKDEEEQAILRSFCPDFLIVAAYGMLLPQSVLDIPALAPINIHTSLLPKYRGCAPVQRAIMDGEEVSGVSIMRMEAGLDTGPVYASSSLPTAGETAGSLLDKMAGRSLPLLKEVLTGVLNGALTPVPQAGESSYAGKIAKAEGLIDVYRPVRVVDCHIRAVTPDPGAHVTLCLEKGEVTVVLEKVHPVSAEGKPGQVLTRKGHLLLACSGGCLEVERLRPQGKKSMDVASFLNGQRLCSSELLVSGTVKPAAGM